MSNHRSNSHPARVLIVGRSPSVLVPAVDLIRSNGHLVDATNQFDQVLIEYDVGELDLLVFGGMVPPDIKQHLREEVAEQNGDVTFLQGLVGIPGVLAAQVEAFTGDDLSAGTEVGYEPDARKLGVVLPEDVKVTVEVFWMKSWRPPEPTSTSLTVFDGGLAAGTHDIAIPDVVPSVASFAVVTAGAQVCVVTIGPMPKAVARMAPRSSTDQRLPDVAAVSTRGPMGRRPAA